MKRLLALIAPAVLALALAGCQLQPLYAGGGKGKVARSLSEIQVAPIPNRAGWLLVNALNDRMGPTAEHPRYRLEIELQDRIEGFGVRNDSSIARERRTLRARYRLIAADKGTVVLDATAGSDVGIDAVASEYATIAAERSAQERLAPIVADQIVTRLARYALHEGQPQPAQ